MTGTIVISTRKSVDMRTVDFVRIVKVLRCFVERSQTAKKLIETVDKFGVNMICADELNPAEFAEFVALMKDVGATLGKDDVDLSNSLEEVYTLIDTDGHFAQ
jgi:hypothetical protein